MLRGFLSFSACLCVVFVLSLSTTALAALTPVEAPPSGEASHAEIFEGVYGGSFTLLPFGSYSNGGVTALRVDDLADQLYPPDRYQSTARAVYASYDQTFGYLPGDQDGTFMLLLDVFGYGQSVTGSANNFTPAAIFRWARSGTQGVIASSSQADNPDGADQLVTYDIQGVSDTESIRLLFFEDVGPDTSDRDFNDLVVEVRTPFSPVTSVPEPAAALLLAPLAGFMASRRRAVRR